MRKFLILAVGIVVSMVCGMLGSNLAFASSLSIAPLEYKANLASGETKKGYVDIVNPEVRTVEVHLEAQAFRQINDQGGLEFYDSEAVTAGVKLDLTDIELGPGEGARIYFLLDGTKLPSGDVFAAILASTGKVEGAVTVPAVRVGTLLMLENGTPSAHHAAITDLDLAWLQIGNEVQAHLTVQNSDHDTSHVTGFSPKLAVGLWPYTSREVQGPLVFAGRNRTVSYSEPGNYFGPMLFRATVDGKTVSRWMFAVTGFWRWLVPLIIVLLTTLWIVWHWVRNRARKH